MLTRLFMQQSAKQLGVEPKRISEGALKLLGLFDFPGNVRQLENVCHWLTVMAPAQVVEVKDLPPEVLASMGAQAAEAQAAAAPDPVPVPAALKTVAPDAAPMAPVVRELVANGAAASSWESDLRVEALQLLEAGRTDVWDELSRRFETALIQAALGNTRGRRIEAAQKLGIGRNTITRKIQELNLE
jgi:two-component system nitrogen regulation response regulator GlnG